MPRKAFRLVIGGQGYDLMGAFGDAGLSDWRALIAATGRGTRDVRLAADAMANLVDIEDLSAASEAHLIDALSDLLFLARRVAGERTLKYQDMADQTSYLALIRAFGQAAADMTAEEEPEPDPTSVRTDSAPDADKTPDAVGIGSSTATTSGTRPGGG